MSHDFDASAALLEQVNHALNSATPLRIQGSGSKAHLGRATTGEVLDTRLHRGIVSSRCRSAPPATTAQRCTCAWRVAKARFRPRANASVAKRSTTATGMNCANSAYRSSLARARCGACRCRPTVVCSTCPVAR